MRRATPLLLLLLLFAGMAIAPPLSAQLRQPQPYQRLVAAVRLRSLMSPPGSLTHSSPARSTGRLVAPPRPRLIGQSLRLELGPRLQLHLDAVWLPSGPRTTAGLVFRFF